jgi:hypothetical protein
MDIKLRLVEEDDAKFILDLRSDESLGKHISKTEYNIDKQIGWIKNYKDKEKQNKEFYFIIEDSVEKYGTVRIYDLKEDSFCWGSWIIKKDSPFSVSIKSALLIYEYAFYKLGYVKSHFDVRKDNQKVVDFHKRMGAVVIEEDSLNYYFNYTIDTYEKTKLKYKKYLS